MTITERVGPRNSGLHKEALRVSLCLKGFLCIFLLFFMAPILAFAFDDDSTVDITRWVTILSACDPTGRTQSGDRSSFKMSCQGDIVLLDDHGKLKKNGRVIFDRRPSDFKVARNGTVYFRYRGRLYKERDELSSGAGSVVQYFVASNGAVVYVTSTGDVYRDGEKLAHGSSKVNPNSRQVLSLLNPNPRQVRNVVVTRQGDAVYKNQGGDLFKNERKLNPITQEVSSFILDEDGNVYWISMDRRLFENDREIQLGIEKVVRIGLGDDHQLIILTTGDRDNLFLGDHRLTAGGSKIIDFHITPSGKAIYTDSHGRHWDDGSRVD